MTRSQLISMLRLSREGAFNYRRRRHNDWTDNYTLYRDKILTNRLTQRQSVNIPLIKTTVKTLLKDIDEPPILYYTNLDNDEQAEVYYNEHWKYSARENKTVIKDIVDKRQVLLFGRSFKKQNIVNGRHYWEIRDPQDILVDRYVDPADLDSARFIFDTHIYKPLSSLRSNPWYDNQAVRRLQMYYASSDGLIKTEANQLDWVEKNARQAALGVIDVNNPILGETYVELNDVFIKMWDAEEKEDVIWYITLAEGMEVLFMAPLDKLIGETRDNYWRYHYPLSTWGDETERTDFWTDGVVDTLRVPNKILNAWFAQLVENRTLQNMKMHFYDSTLAENFIPQTFTPVPFGMFPVPGDPNKIMKEVSVGDMGDTIEEMQFLIGICEKASAATSLQEGQQQAKQITLGEVNLLLNEAKESVKSMKVYYKDSWEEFGLKYSKLLEAGGHLIDDVTIHKSGRLTKKMYTKTVGPADWETKMGYSVEVKMKEDKQSEDENALQWLNAAKTVMPNNPIVDEEYKMKLLENSKMSSEKIDEALKFDKQQQQAMLQQPMGMGGPMQPGPVQPAVTQPIAPQLPAPAH